MQPTEEQQQIIDYDLDKEKIIKVLAFAGTGKTTSLILFTQKRPQWRFLYVAFNKSVQVDASTKFPKNVTCKTSHSLAWPKFGSLYVKKLTNTLRINNVMEVLEITDYVIAKIAIDTLMKFLISLDDKISKKHIPELAYAIKKKHIPEFVTLAEKLWTLMTDEKDESIGMLHDGYLKLYQQSKPYLNFDCILIDEAQDTNPITAEFLLSQRCAKVLVGDPHQQIYQFRGATDAMNNINASKTLYLTHSFRFGNHIASLSNKLLKTFKNENHSLVGHNKDSIGNVSGIYTVIARTNSLVFEEAVNAYEKKKIGFVGGIFGYRFSLIVDTYYLFDKNKKYIKDAYIKSFDSFESMKSFAEEVDDRELKSRCRTVEKHKHHIPDLVKKITAKSVENLEDADIILSTAHKSKGLEFDKIRLTDDFVHLMKDGNLISSIDLEMDEINMIYVAITRCRNSLELPESLQKFHEYVPKVENLNSPLLMLNDKK